MAEWPDESSTDSARSLGQNAKAADRDDPETIRAGINETRERLSDTLTELGERLNPQVVKEQITERVKEGIHDATIGRIGHMARSAADSVNSTRTGITDTIRENPVPAAMVAIGLGWLLFNGRRSSESSGSWNSERDFDSSRTSGRYSSSNQFAGSYPYDQDSSDMYEGESGVSRKFGNVRDRVSNTAGSVADSVKERAGNLADRGRDLADRAGSRASSMASSVSTRAQDVAGSVKQRTSQGARRVEDSFYDNPLALGAITMALGVVAGLAAPVTDREVQLMGDARDRVVDRVKDVAGDVADDAKQAAHHVADRLMDEAKRAVKDESGTLKASVTSAVKGTSAQSSTPSAGTSPMGTPPMGTS